MRRRADGATGKEVDLLRIALTNGEDPDYLMNAESMVTNRLRALGFGSNAKEEEVSLGTGRGGVYTSPYRPEHDVKLRATPSKGAY